MQHIISLFQQQLLEESQTKANQSNIGVINEPPPTPVNPTIKPTAKPAMTNPIWKSIKKIFWTKIRTIL